METALVTELLPDVIAPGLFVLFCGINPGLSSAAAGHSFSNKSNRFWQVLYGARFTPRLLTASEDQRLIEFGLGVTTAAARPTRSADELSAAELRDSAAALKAKIERYAPLAVAFLGKAAYCAIEGRTSVEWGLQPSRFAGAKAWVLPNPSGLNRRFALVQLVDAYSALRKSIEP
jgi:TDG/mug DNA glycosylase family protein